MRASVRFQEIVSIVSPSVHLVRLHKVTILVLRAGKEQIRRRFPLTFFSW